MINPTIVILNNATLQYIHSCYHTAKAFQESHLLLQQAAAMLREDQAKHGKVSPNHTGMREAEADCVSRQLHKYLHVALQTAPSPAGSKQSLACTAKPMETKGWIGFY